MHAMQEYHEVLGRLNSYFMQKSLCELTGGGETKTWGPSHLVKLSLFFLIFDMVTFKYQVMNKLIEKLGTDVSPACMAATKKSVLQLF